MKTKFTKVIALAAFLIAAAPALIAGLTAPDSLNKSGVISNAYSTEASTDYKGPLCTDGAGTYCCKDSATNSCSSSMKCAGCKENATLN